MSVRIQRSVLPALLLAGGLAAIARQPRAAAGEWPQILGPARNGIAEGEDLSAVWTGGEPRTLWQRAVGSGYAGVAVSAGRVLLFHRLEDQEVCEALDAASGKTIWKAAFPTKYVSSIASDDGPRCVPLVHQGQVILFGAEGKAHCLSLAEGQVRWSRNLTADFAAPEGYFGAGSTPLADGDRLLFNVGGKSNGGLVALALADGKTLWQATDEAASYSAATAATIDGARHAIFVTRLNVVSVDPENGQVRFRFPFGSRGPTVNAATPLVLGERLFVSASYGVGAVLAKIGNDSAEELWRSAEVMSSQYTTCVFKDGHLYGIDGRQDQGVAELRCIDPFARRIVWAEPGFGTGNLILAGDRLLILKTDGELVLAAASPERFRKLAAARVLSGTAQALPALAGGLLYARDQQTLKCLVVGRIPPL